MYHSLGWSQGYSMTPGLRKYRASTNWTCFWISTGCFEICRTRENILSFEIIQKIYFLCSPLYPVVVYDGYHWNRSCGFPWSCFSRFTFAIELDSSKASKYEIVKKLLLVCLHKPDFCRPSWRARKPQKNEILPMAVGTFSNFDCRSHSRRSKIFRLRPTVQHYDNS